MKMNTAWAVAAWLLAVVAPAIGASAERERLNSILARPGSAGSVARVSGILRDVDGQPVPNFALSVVPEYLVTSRNVRTDAQGRFEVIPNAQLPSLRNRKLCVVARDSARNLAAAEVIESDTITLELRLEPGRTVAGSLTDLEGKALSTGTAQVSLRMGSLTVPLRAEPFRVDAQGHFAINALPADHPYWLSVTAPGYGSTTRNVPAGAAETNRLELGSMALKVANLPLAGRVVDAEQRPATNAWVSLSGEGQPSESVEADKLGRFKFKGVCEGTVRLFANAMNAFANTTAEAGDTNVVIVLGSNPGMTVPRPKRAALKGRPLPDLVSVGLSASAVPAGKPLLVCLFDIEQRPSRRFIRLLAEQAETIRRNGVVVVGVQAGPDTASALTEWQAANPLPFPVGQVARETAGTKWVSEVESFPWMILTDKARRVAAEGFSLEDLEARIKEL